MVRGIANSKIGFGDLILLLRYFFKLKVSTHPNKTAILERLFYCEFSVLRNPKLSSIPVEYPRWLLEGWFVRLAG